MFLLLHWDAVFTLSHFFLTANVSHRTLFGSLFGWYAFYCCFYVGTDKVFRVSALNVSRTNESKWLYTKKGKKQMIPCKNYYRCNYTDSIAFLANTPTQAKSLLHSLEQAAGGIGFHMKANKMEYMCFNHKRRYLHSK